MEGDFLPMDLFEDSPIFEVGDNEQNIIDNETVMSDDETQAAVQNYLNGNNDSEENNNENNNAVEDEENPEVVDSEEDVNEGGNEDNDSDSSSNLYSSLASVIHEQGLLPSVDINNDNIQSVDDLARVLRIEQEAQAKQLFENYINNLDVDKIKQPLSDMRSLDAIDSDYLFDNIEVAKDLIRQDYMNQGLDESKINRIINRLIDLGDEDLIDESLKARESLIEKNAKAIEEEKNRQFKERAELEKQNLKVQEEIKKRIFESEIIEGFKPTQAFKQKMYDTMTSIVGTDPNGNPENAFMKARREDLIGFETRMYAFFELTNGFTDFSKLIGPSKSKAVEELEKAVRGTVINKNSTPNYINDKESYFGTGDYTLNI